MLKPAVTYSFKQCTVSQVHSEGTVISRLQSQGHKRKISSDVCKVRGYVTVQKCTDLGF